MSFAWVAGGHEITKNTYMDRNTMRVTAVYQRATLYSERKGS